MPLISPRRILVDLSLMPRWTVLTIGFVLGVVAMLVSHLSLLPWRISTAERQTGLKAKHISEAENFKKILDQNIPIKEIDDRLSRAIDKQVRVLCWIMIKERDNVKANASRATWAKRCDVLLFFGRDTTYDAIDVGVKEGKIYLAEKTFACLTYIYKNHLQDADWFLKADSDAYVIMENLKYFLSDEDQSSPVYFGEYYNPYGSDYIHYNSGGAGYVMSREALRRFGEEGAKKSVCAEPGGPEDKALGYCLLHLGVKLGKSTDKLDRTRFHYDQASMRVEGNVKPWYRQFMGNRYQEGINSLSMYPITFHYLQHYDIHMLEYVFYRLAPHGIVKSFPEMNNEELTSDWLNKSLQNVIKHRMEIQDR